MSHNLNLNWLRSFEAAARLLSFTAAGIEKYKFQTIDSAVYGETVDIVAGEKQMEIGSSALESC